MWVGTLSLVILSLGMIAIGVTLLLRGYIYWGVVVIASPVIPTLLIAVVLARRRFANRFAKPS